MTSPSSGRWADQGARWPRRTPGCSPRRRAKPALRNASAWPGSCTTRSPRRCTASHWVPVPPRALAENSPDQVIEPLDYVLSLAEAGMTEMRSFDLRAAPGVTGRRGGWSPRWRRRVGGGWRARHQTDRECPAGHRARGAAAAQGRRCTGSPRKPCTTRSKHAHASHVEVRLSVLEDQNGGSRSATTGWGSNPATRVRVISACSRCASGPVRIEVRLRSKARSAWAPRCVPGCPSRADPQRTRRSVHFHRVAQLQRVCRTSRHRGRSGARSRPNGAGHAAAVESDATVGEETPTRASARPCPLGSLNSWLLWFLSFHCTFERAEGGSPWPRARRS